MVWQGPLGPGRKSGGGDGCLLGTRARSWGGATPSDSDADGGSGEIDAIGFSTLCVCNGTLFGMGTLGDAATCSHWQPLLDLFFMLIQSPSATSRVRCLWNSWTAPQNVSGGASACTAHHWSTMASAMVSSFTLPSNPGSARGLWAPGTLSSSVLTGWVGWARCHVLPFEQPVDGKPQLDGGPDAWLGHHHGTHPQSG